MISDAGEGDPGIFVRLFYPVDYEVGLSILSEIEFTAGRKGSAAGEPSNLGAQERIPGRAGHLPKTVAVEDTVLLRLDHRREEVGRCTGGPAGRHIRTTSHLGVPSGHDCLADDAADVKERLCRPGKFSCFDLLAWSRRKSLHVFHLLCLDGCLWLCCSCYRA